MKLKSMHATFGNLHEKTLFLKDGMNVLHGSNESGKSTWCAFLRVMLYGVSTREKSKQGFLADKEKYAPWSGAPMYGRIEFSWNGKNCVLERTANKAGILQKAVLCDADTGAVLQVEEPVGETLLGVKREVFERSAFIAQSQLMVCDDKSGELERKIASLATTGEEDVSNKLVISRLEKWQRKLQFYKKGEIPELENALDETQEALFLQRADAAQITEARYRIEECIKRQGVYQNAIDRWKVKKAQEQLEFIKETKEELKNCEEAYALANSRGCADAATINGMEQAAAEYRIKRDESVEQVHHLQTEQAILNEMAPLKEETIKHSAVAVGTGILTVAALALVNWILAFVAGLLVAGSAYLLIKKQFYRKNNVKNKNEFVEKQHAYLKQTLLVEQLERTCALANEEYTRAEEKLRNRLAEAGQMIPPQDADKFIQGEKKKAFELEHVKASLAAAREKLHAAQIGRDIEKLAAMATMMSDLSVPQYSEEELLEMREQNERQLREQEHRCVALEERMSARGELIALEETANEIQSKLEMKRADKDAIDLAITTLEEVQNELARQFAPALESKTREIFAMLTGGHFEVVQIKNAQLEMSVAENQASPPRDILYLSQGTLDELYFAMRLALCETVLPEDAPLVLDDALVNFDDIRMGRTLDYLEKRSQKRQIILFSCHKREAEYYEGYANIHKQIIQ